MQRALDENNGKYTNYVKKVFVTKVIRPDAKLTQRFERSNYKGFKKRMMDNNNKTPFVRSVYFPNDTGITIAIDDQLRNGT